MSWNTRWILVAALGILPACEVGGEGTAPAPHPNVAAPIADEPSEKSRVDPTLDLMEKCQAAVVAEDWDLFFLHLAEAPLGDSYAKVLPRFRIPKPLGSLRRHYVAAFRRPMEVQDGSDNLGQITWLRAQDALMVSLGHSSLLFDTGYDWDTSMAYRRISNEVSRIARKMSEPE